MAKKATYQHAQETIRHAQQEGAIALTLSGMDLTELPEDIGQLAQLQTLHLTGTPLPPAAGSTGLAHPVANAGSSQQRPDRAADGQ